MARLAAVILAGGKGKRLGGVIKAGLVVGAARLLDRVSVALGDLPSPVLVAYGSVPLGQLALRAGQIPVPDLCSDYEGPLAGLAGAVDWCARMAEPAEYLLSVAVDTPFLPDDFASRMLAAIGPADAVVACHAGQGRFVRFDEEHSDGQ